MHLGFQLDHWRSLGGFPSVGVCSIWLQKPAEGWKSSGARFSTCCWDPWLRPSEDKVQFPGPGAFGQTVCTVPRIPSSRLRRGACMRQACWAVSLFSSTPQLRRKRIVFAVTYVAVMHSCQACRQFILCLRELRCNLQRMLLISTFLPGFVPHHLFCHRAQTQNRRS